MKTPKTIIELTVVGDKFVASCPHVPDAEVSHAEHAKDSRAVNRVIRQVRNYIDGGDEKEWVSEPAINKDADQVLHLTGLWPAWAQEPGAEPTITELSEDDTEDKESSDAD